MLDDFNNSLLARNQQGNRVVYRVVIHKYLNDARHYGQSREIIDNWNSHGGFQQNQIEGSVPNILNPNHQNHWLSIIRNTIRSSANKIEDDIQHLNGPLLILRKQNYDDLRRIWRVGSWVPVGIAAVVSAVKEMRFLHMTDILNWTARRDTLHNPSYLKRVRENNILDWEFPVLISNNFNTNNIHSLFQAIKDSYERNDRWKWDRLVLNHLNDWNRLNDEQKEVALALIRHRFSDATVDEQGLWVIPLPPTRKAYGEEQLREILETRNRPVGGENVAFYILQERNKHPDLSGDRETLNEENVRTYFRRNPNDFYVGERGSSVFGLRDWIESNVSWAWEGGLEELLNRVLPPGGNGMIHCARLVAQLRRSGRYVPRMESIGDRAKKSYQCERKNNWISRSPITSEPLRLNRIPEYESALILIQSIGDRIKEFHGALFFDIYQNINIEHDPTHEIIDYFEYILWDKLITSGLYTIDGWGYLQALQQGPAPVLAPAPIQHPVALPGRQEPAEEEIGIDVFNGDAATRARVEQLAMDACRTYFAQRGAQRIEDVSAQRCGWDIQVRFDDCTIYVEVKGRRSGGQMLIFTRNEVKQSCDFPGHYLVFLAYVDNNAVQQCRIRCGPIQDTPLPDSSIAVIHSIEQLGNWEDVQ